MEESLQSPISASSFQSELGISGKLGEESLKNFPDELIIEILTWLPAKTLLRFRCVSKFWRSVISTPKFIKAHLKNFSSRDDCAHHRVLFRSDTLAGELVTGYFPLAPVLFGNANTPIASIPVEDPVMNGGDTRIVGASNGVVCVCVKLDIFFWNPAIRRFKKLPEIPTPFNQLVKRQVMFEYNKVDDDYQVCVIDVDEKWICVYSANTNSWKQIQGFVARSSGYFLVRGRLYWDKGTTKRIEICYFDLKTETYGVLQQPDYGKGTYDLQFGGFDGCLAVYCYHRTSHIDMWILKKHRSRQSWTKVLLFPKLKDSVRKKSCRPIFMSKDGKILFLYGKFLARFDPMKKSVTYPRVKSMVDPWKHEVLVESLVLINDHDAKGPVKDTDCSATIDTIRHLFPHLHLV